ncbi:hypothetical protein BurMR1_3063 [Burkholderia sp. MR1]|nr:hypothetical protein BurMR1_3063 [Burkholderia sp. MR1]
MAIGDWQSMLAKADRVIGWRFDDEQPERVVPLCAFGEHPLEKLTYGEGPEYFRAIIHPDGSVETSWSEGFPNFNAFHSSYARRAVENK